MARKRRITAEDLYRFRFITDFDLSPDGKQVVYSVQRVNRKNEKKFSNLYLVPTSGGRSRRFTYGDHVDARPRFSPDGRTIAFLSNRGHLKPAQLHLIPVNGGEARQLTRLKGSIQNFEWSPDGKRFVIGFRKTDEEVLEREKDPDRKKLGVVCRNYDRVFFKLDGFGYLPKERSHIWILDAKSGKGRQITDHPVFDESGPAWSPDGRSIVFTSNRTKEPDLDPGEVGLYVVPVRGGRIRQIPAPTGPKGSPMFSPDGKHIAYLGVDGKGKGYKNTELWVVGVNGRPRARSLTRHLDLNISGGANNDMVAHDTRPAWSPDGGSICYPFQKHGNAGIQRIALAGKRPEMIVNEQGAVGVMRFSKDGRTLCHYLMRRDDPGQIYARNGGPAKRLTSLNDDVLKNVDLGRIEEVWVPAGRRKIHGWVLKPPGFSPRRKYPSILEIHGGPRTQYGNTFMHEFYYLAAQGYVVHFSNPRGGRGYGEAHSKAIVNGWGTRDYQDVMAWTDWVQRRPYIDTRRMGVTGGSYGGYMTCWIIGHTRRFKAAVTQRSVSNLVSMWGSSDFNWAFEREFGFKPPWANLQNFWKMSPMAHIGNARTPTLVIHSEMDLRCAIEQSEQVFVALKKQGVDSELVRFPEEPHGLSRGGRTDRRIARLNHILRWFDAYLK